MNNQILELILDKLTSMEEKFDKKFEEIEEKFNRKFEEIDGKFEKIEAEQKRQGDLLHQLIQSVAATNVRISDTNERLDKLEQKVDAISEDIKEIKETMATKKDLEFYDQMISEHSREIYKLRNR